MIKNITIGAGLVGNGSPFTPYIPMNTASAGLVRYNGTNQCLEVYDGSTWQTLGSHADIRLDDRAVRAIDWVYKKMDEERQLEELMRKHPTVAKAKEHLDTVIALTKDYQHV